MFEQCGSNFDAPNVVNVGLGNNLSLNAALGDTNLCAASSNPFSSKEVTTLSRKVKGHPNIPTSSSLVVQ